MMMPSRATELICLFLLCPIIYCRVFWQITEEGGVVISGRSDAVLNPGGIRIGTAEIYRQASDHIGVFH